MVKQLAGVFVELCRIRAVSDRVELVEPIDDALCAVGAAMTHAAKLAIDELKEPKPVEIEEDEKGEGFL